MSSPAFSALPLASRRCINGAQATVAAAGAEQARAVITDPPLLQWHESTHAAFPRRFQQQAEALLLCWHRLTGCGAACSSSGSSDAAPSGSSSSGEAAADLGCLPSELVGAGRLSACAPLLPGLTVVTLGSVSSQRHQSTCLPSNVPVHLPAPTACLCRLPPSPCCRCATSSR